MIDLRRIQGAPPLQQETAVLEKQNPKVEQPFAEVLEKAKGSSGELKFSAHALERMTQRGIGLTPLELEKVQSAVQKASDKGSRSSLVLLDERAFVVSVANRTVITAMDGDNMKDQMVTDIDSAVII
ncbi:flagellar protein [candidate division LCP-89 bacterium B3_LCP]|uniref:Flagellar protein n=1 Tax=candidate division LCP-89 bacterium B3_LCP TaxID=2012998 RepID=A0A532V519_UNCL8|nr:MAG: flagellar protein [candidate division LCP-89 bacterium B3_LCP]